jgi:hypothetical protein
VFDQAGHAYSLDHALAANDSYSFYDGLSKDYVDTYSIGVQGLKSRLVRMEVGLCGKNDKVRTQIKSSRLKTVAGGTTLEIPITSPGGVALKP